MPSKITLSFRGEKYTIPADRSFQIGEQIEDIVTLGEIAAWGTRPKFFKIARCFATMLRFAGCSVSDGEVHSEMMDSIKRQGGDADLAAMRALDALVAVLMDGVPEAGSSEAPAKKESAS